MKKRASLHNLGCKVNAYEMDVMEELLEAAHEELGEDGCANLEKLIEPLTIQNS